MLKLSYCNEENNFAIPRENTFLNYLSFWFGNQVTYLEMGLFPGYDVDPKLQIELMIQLERYMSLSWRLLIET